MREKSSLQAISRFDEAVAKARLSLTTANDDIRELRLLIDTTRQRISEGWECLTRASTLARASTMTRSSSMDLSFPSGMIRPQSETGGAMRTFAAVTKLIEQVEQSTLSDTEVVSSLVSEIILAAGSLSDPSLLVGILLESTVQAVRERFPIAEQRETAIALCGLLFDHITQGRAEPAT